MVRLRRRAVSDDDGSVSGRARRDRRTKDLIPRLNEGDIALIYHQDIDHVAAEGLIAAGAVAVVNAASSMSGRYPSLGAMTLVRQGVPLLDEVGSETLNDIEEGSMVTVADDDLLVDGQRMGHGVRQDLDSLEVRYEQAKEAVNDQIADFAANTLEYIANEPHLITERPAVPDLRVDINQRHVLVVVRGLDYREDMLALRRIGYVQDLRPILIGVDGGADALLENGYKPDIIIGDFDSVTQDSLRVGAELIVQGYPGGEAPGTKRLERLGFDYKVMESGGTSEDIALQLAFEKGAELIVLVGSHTSLVDFLDKGREGMASTFLTRMKVGPDPGRRQRCVTSLPNSGSQARPDDSRAVSLVYDHGHRHRH